MPLTWAVTPLVLHSIDIEGGYYNLLFYLCFMCNHLITLFLHLSILSDYVYSEALTFVYNKISKLT